MNQAQFKALINGDTAVTDEIAHTLALVTGRPAETWLRLQLEYDRAIARNRMQHETGADTFVYRIDDEFGHPIEYGVATDLADIVTQDERIGDELSLDQITDRLHPDVAARKLAKLQRAFRNRKQRQAAETAAARDGGRQRAGGLNANATLREGIPYVSQSRNLVRPSHSSRRDVG